MGGSPSMECHKCEKTKENLKQNSPKIKQQCLHKWQK